MKCSACGEENVQNAKFCCFCGAKLSAACPTPAANSSDQDESDRTDAHTAQPVSENPYQPRKMPTIYSNPLSQESAEKKSTMPSAARPQKVFLFDDEDDEDDEREAREEPRKVNRAPQRKRNDDPFYDDEDDEDDYSDDDEESSGRGGKIFVAVISVVTILILVVGLYAFAFYTPIGCRMRAYYGLSNEAKDYIYLAEWQQDSGNKADAATSYYKAFLLNQDDYEFALQTAKNFEACNAMERAEQMYMYLIEKYPLEDDPYDYLMALLVTQNRTDAYNALITYRAEHQEGYVPDPAQITTPAPDAPIADPQGGSYNGTVKVSFTAAEGALIYFTADGTDPTESSQLYNGPITLYSGSYTLRAIAVVDGVSSGITSATYTVS